MRAIIRAINYTGDDKILKEAYDEHLDFIFMDWFNNFLTVERFAEYYDLEIKQAKKAIDAGREIHDKRVNRLEVIE
tara:strand:- start:51 stop:278 length:228 start_codon:yes stop_codon:yes gene_type:complete